MLSPFRLRMQKNTPKDSNDRQESLQPVPKLAAKFPRLWICENLGSTSQRVNIHSISFNPVARCQSTLVAVWAFFKHLDLKHTIF